MDYYQLPRISNSDLTIAMHIITGTPYEKPETAFRFGGVFHELLLEPEKFRTESCDGLDIPLLYRMYRTVLGNQYCQHLLEDSEKEKVVLWQEPTTRVACKCKLDLVVDRQDSTPLVVDFKTTSARNLPAFLNCCRMYHYDRQMAFYADSINAQRICLIGVSKKAKRLFFVQKCATSPFIVEGRRKYHHLLRKVKELDLYEAIYYARGNESGTYSNNRQPTRNKLKEPSICYLAHP
ncbi:PD-(D/E)XK nuclease-like domain-containing protein [Tunicatimonas pelagia]|uniref:PD-(D/E)XK nuclease-like domain-containing protein n=1 Tax=Tunicatimonas pelagia TaxID=931531 RepID=UPI0026650462|nr:PD-(D/E)XK nuclease-like domain-containing protein [Tunicatimonas pelagia]WKN44902.1 PD-(D/E)XK nuclease-like domain-containing protein [Tunicatimonas pelagia]